MLFPSWKLFFKAILPVSLTFIIWDHFVTNFFWSFNKNFITGLTIGKLPIEEILFFFTVPYACLVLWVNIKKQMRQKEEIIPVFLVYCVGMILFIWSIYSLMNGLWYTTIVCLIFSSMLIVLKTFLISKQGIVLTLCVIVLTFIFNLYLTSRPIVEYFTQYKTNIHVLSIPIEDFIYGLILIVPIVYRYEKYRL